MNVVTIIGVVAAYALVFMAAICLLAEKGIHPFRRLRRKFAKLPFFAKLLVMGFGVTLFVHGSLKSPTNDPPRSVPVVQQITQENVDQGFVLAGMSANVAPSVFNPQFHPGTEQGAGGVGGLLAMSVDGEFYIPCYDHNGNIVRYMSETGVSAVQYTYDPYGNIIESFGPLADVFSFCFSTKYHDREIGIIGYQQRVYRPDFGRWLNRDPIEEEGGENLYAFCNNIPSFLFDRIGLITVFPVNSISGTPRYSQTSDLWIGIYVEYGEQEQSGTLVIRRSIAIDLCPCGKDGKPIKQNRSLVSYVTVQNKFGVSSSWTFSGNKQRTYFEIASLKSYKNYKGRITVRYSVSFTTSTAHKEAGKKASDNIPFGSQDSAHGVTNFEDTGKKVVYSSSASSSIVLQRSCSDTEFADLKKFTQEGSWGTGPTLDRLGTDCVPRSQGGDNDAPWSNEYPFP